MYALYSEGNENYVLDEFETTPPTPTYALGFLISELSVVEAKFKGQWKVAIYSRSDIKHELVQVYEKVELVLKSLTNYFAAEYPLQKLDIVALPGLSAVKPIDNWGLVIFK